MRRRIWIAFVAGAALACLAVPRPLEAQACKDDEMIANEFRKEVADLVGTVKKESLEDFQKAYHQKSCLSKLAMSLSAVNGLLGCLDKAAKETTATQEDVAAYKAKHASYTKLKGKIESDRDTVKGTEDAKQAKALIGKIDLLD